MFILLVGMMGSGKSTVGSALAKKLGYEFVEMDKLILEQTGFDTVKDVYDYRTSFWKECELDVSKNLTLEEDLVIACGGGIVENQLNFLYFEESKKPFCIVYLETLVEKLVERIVKKNTSKIDAKELEKHILSLIERRDDLCKKVANITVNTSKLDVDDVCNTITKEIN